MDEWSIGKVTDLRAKLIRHNQPAKAKDTLLLFTLIQALISPKEANERVKIILSFYFTVPMLMI